MNIFFSGIGGVGLGPLAEIALDAGYEITGSDCETTESLMAKQLRSRGVEINNNQNGEYLQESHNKKPLDWFIYTSALPADHPELVIAKQLGIRIAKRDELLSHIIKDKNLKLIAISGTHGKTSTTGLMIWALEQLGIPISYSVGTTMTFGQSGKFDPSSEYFIYECDEFDRNFLHFYPYLALVTSMDHDHGDTYPTQDGYFLAFHQFISQAKHTFFWSDQNGDIFKDLPQAQIVEPNEVYDFPGIYGQHSRRNATLVKKGLEYLGINNDIDEVLANFPGVGRRFEKLADNLYTDYAHHPIEIAATLQMAREMSDHIVLVYAPHQNIRQHHILENNQYKNEFELADEIYWLPTYLSREDPKLEILQPSVLIKNITNKNSIHIADFNDELWQSIQAARHEGKMVLCMGAGNIDGWLREQLVKSLQPEMSLVS